MLHGKPGTESSESALEGGGSSLTAPTVVAAAGNGQAEWDRRRIGVRTMQSFVGCRCAGADEAHCVWGPQETI